MRTRTIRVSEDTARRLREWAEPFESRDQAVARVLDAAEAQRRAEAREGAAFEEAGLDRIAAVYRNAALRHAECAAGIEAEAGGAIRN